MRLLAQDIQRSLAAGSCSSAQSQTSHQMWGEEGALPWIWRGWEWGGSAARAVWLVLTPHSVPGLASLYAMGLVLTTWLWPADKGLSENVAEADGGASNSHVHM